MDNLNGLSPAETERLAILAEEASEVIQVVGKILRHGFESCHPDTLESGRVPVTNRQLLERELGDLLFAIEMCVSNQDAVGEAVIIAKEMKAERIIKHLHYNDVIDFYVEQETLEDEDDGDGG